MKTKCLDTCALIDIAMQNPRFNLYLNAEVVIPNTTLAEFYGWILRKYDERTALFWTKKCEPYVVPVETAILVSAMNFRHAHQKKNISFFDAVGYAFALEQGYAFVTSDGAFRNMQNVEFIR